MYTEVLKDTRCFYLAPCSSSNFTTSSCPYLAASCNEFLPLLSFASTSAPRSSSRRTTSNAPFIEAKCNGLQPFSPCAFISAPCSSSNRKTEPSLKLWPPDARSNGVHPPSFLALMSAGCSQLISGPPRNFQNGLWHATDFSQIGPGRPGLRH
jgi:hypothetical protein